MLFSKTKDEYVPEGDTSNSDGSSFSKRFPWFGSFGKGNKKENRKKERCFSQFYASSNVKDSIFHEKNRTKSLPNIKHPREF